jgi:hypothetical protein
VNILEIEDMVKGLPDQALQKEAQQPTGQIPQFLVVSEIQRRGDMRQRFQKRQENQGTVKDQVMQQGIAAMGAPQPEMQALAGGPPMPPQGMPPQGMQQPMPPQAMPQGMPQQPPMGMYAGGVVQMADGRAAPFFDDPRLAELRAQGLTDEQIAQEIRRLGLNENLISQIGLPTLGTMEATMQPDAYSQDAYADIFARQQGDIPAGMEFVEPRNVDDLLSPARSQMTPAPSPVGQEAIDAMYQSEYGKMLAQQSQARRDAEVASPAVGGGQDFVPSQRGIGSAPEGTAAALQAQIQALSSNPASPSDQADFAMPDFDSYRQMINSALAPPEGTGDRRVGNLFGSDQVAPSNVDGSAPVSALPAADNSALAAQLVAESQARRGREASPAVGTFDAPAPQDNALIEQLIAGSEARRNQEASPAVRGGLTDAEFQARNREVVSGLIPDFLKNDPSNTAFDFLSSEGGSSQPINDSPRRQAMLESMERIRQAQANAPLLPFVTQGTKSELIARGRENPILSSIEAGTAAADLEQSQERIAASLEGSPLEGIYGSPLGQSSQFNMAENLIDIANNQAGAVQADGNRGVLTGSVANSDVVDLALAGDTSASASGRSNVGNKDEDRTGTGEGIAVQGTTSAEDRLVASQGKMESLSDLIQQRAAGVLSAEMSYADRVRRQKSPTLSYQGLLSDYEKQMESQLADIKREKGSQALIALGAGIARGDLGAGLSDAGKAAAASNAQKRALEARQQAMQMGLKKSEIDAAFQSEVQKQANELESQKIEIAALKSYGASQDGAEQAVLTFATGIDKALADIGLKRDYYDQLNAQQQATSRRAALDFVADSMKDLGLVGKSPEFVSATQDIFLQKAANALQITIDELVQDKGKSGTKPNTSRFQVEEI